jgi:hypothetical protein
MGNRVEAMNRNAFATPGSDLTHQNPRRRARHAAVTVLSGPGHVCVIIERALRRPRIYFLLLHHVFPHEEAHFRGGCREPYDSGVYEQEMICRIEVATRRLGLGPPF